MTDVITARNGVGAAIGAAVGFLFGGPLGAGVGALLGGAVAHASTSTNTDAAVHGELTPKRKLIFQRAMESVKEPNELRTLAAAYESQGLKSEGLMLRKRAALRELPEDVQVRRRTAYRQAMSSDNPKAIDGVADAFMQESAYTAARNIHDHANAVRAAHAAGKSGRPMPTTGNKGDQNTLESFADKLAKAVMHFGPASNEAKAAARNLIQAQGKPVSDQAVATTLAAASAAIGPQAAPATSAPQAQAAGEEVPPGGPSALDTTPASPSPSPTAVGVELMPEDNEPLADTIDTTADLIIEDPLEAVGDVVEEFVEGGGGAPAHAQGVRAPTRPGTVAVPQKRPGVAQPMQPQHQQGVQQPQGVAVPMQHQQGVPMQHQQGVPMQHETQAQPMQHATAHRVAGRR
jgi:hypothetical protein